MKCTFVYIACSISGLHNSPEYTIVYNRVLYISLHSYYEITAQKHFTVDNQKKFLKNCMSRENIVK
jgi:hypothetical protein